MKDIQKCLENDESIKSSAEEYAKDIGAKRLDLTEFVESLGSVLTSTDVDVRGKAMRLLSATLTNLSTDFLNSVALNFITTFYCDRLKDHHSVVPPTLTGIEALIKMTNLPDECATRLLQSMFQNVPCQSQVREDRTKIFNIISELSKTKTKELLNMGPDFVYGFINAMDGERDPRILLFLFDFVPNFFRTFPLGHLSEEAFEVIACYFPIDFNPSASDSGVITRDQLAEKLADCLCSHESFAEDCINLLIEKLDSQLSIAKLDSLYLLSKASQTFAAATIEKCFPDIWKGLSAELLPGSSKDITIATLDALQVLLVSVAKDETALSNVLTIILSAIVPSLSDVNSRLFGPSAAIALKCSQTSKLSAEIVSLKCLPAFLLQINKDNEQEVQRGTLIELSGQLILTCIEYEVVNEIDEKLLETAQFEFINCLMQKTSENEKIIKTAMQALAITAPIVVESNRTLVYRVLNSYLLEASATQTTPIDCGNVLSAFAARYPDEVSREIVNHILNIDYITEKLTPTAIAELFESLCCLIPIRKFREEILEFLFHNIFDAERKAEIRLIGVRVLRHILEDDKNEELHKEMYVKYKVFDRFFEFIHSKELNETNEDRLTGTDDFLYEMSQILRIVTTDLDASTQKELVEKYLKTINLKLKSDLYFALGLLGYLEKSVDLENHFDHLVDELTQLSLKTEDEEITKISNQLLCSLFNKCPDNSHNTGILKKVIKLIKDELKKHNKKAVEVLSYISKGLAARGHTEAAELIDTLIELLEHPSLSEAAVCTFDILSTECPSLHLPVIKHLFKQKLFQICMKGLWHKLEAYSEKHLSAFVFVLKFTPRSCGKFTTFFCNFPHLPHQVLKNDIEKIGPVLLKCLTLTNVKSLSSALAIIKHFIVEQNEYFRDHLQSLIPQCVKLTTFADSMNIRINSIEILSAITKYPAFIVLPYAQDVLFGLQPALDDHKRLVRNAAVLARNQWFLVGVEQ